MDMGRGAVDPLYYQWIMSYSGPLIYLLFWDQQQMHHPQSMQQTPP
jgi:hypothetical protein